MVLFTRYVPHLPTLAPRRRRRLSRKLRVYLPLTILWAFSAAAEARKSPGTGSSPEENRLAKIYQAASPAIVGISCRNRDGGRDNQYVGSGAIVDPMGLVLTSTTVVPPGSTAIQVYLRGGVLRKARVLKTVSDNEFCLLLMDKSGTYPFLNLGDSDNVHIGQTSLSFGNAFRSIDWDDQVTMAAGIVSGIYTLMVAQSEAKYVGPVIETTASVNDYMDGGPLLNAKGEIIGLISLNYATQRWLGTAVPVNRLKPMFGRYRRWVSDRYQPTNAYLGIEVIQTDDGALGQSIQISQVYRNGPAGRAGLRTGDQILTLNDIPVYSIEGYKKVLDRTKPGSKLRIRISPGTTTATETAARELVIPVWGRF